MEIDNFEREFFKLATTMLLTRYQLVNNCSCVRIKGYVTMATPFQFGFINYIGYHDHISEMHALCKEKKNQ